jgi:hypothetical protein
MLGWPNHIGGGRPPQHIFFLKKNIYICDEGILKKKKKKRSKWSNCYNLKVWGGGEDKMLYLKLWR